MKVRAWMPPVAGAASDQTAKVWPAASGATAKLTTKPVGEERDTGALHPEAGENSDVTSVTLAPSWSTHAAAARPPCAVARVGLKACVVPLLAKVDSVDQPAAAVKLRTSTSMCGPCASFHRAH